MTTERDRLLVLVEARVNELEKGMRRATQATQRARRDIEKEADKLSKNLETKMAKAGGGFGGVMGLARNALGIAGVGLGARGIIDMTSAWSDLNSRVNNAVGSMDRGADVMARLSEMARRTYSGLTQTAEAWLQNSTALTELGYSVEQQLDLTEALNNSLVISATRGQQAESVMRAWSQALALGELRGQNLNSVIQGSSRLTKALADSMGVSTTELRKLGSEGKITTADMYGLTSQLDTLRAEADAMPATLVDSFVLFGDAVFKLVGQADQATGATAKFAAEIIQLSDAIDRYAGPAVDILGALGDAYERLSDSPAGLALGTGSMTGPGYILDLLEAAEDLSAISFENLEVLESRIGETRLVIMDLASEIAMLENVRMFAPDLPDEIQAVIDKLVLGEMSADEAKSALLALGQANLDFSPQIGQLAGLVDELNAVTNAAGQMASALNAPQGPTSRSAGANRAAIAERAGIGADYVSEQERLLSLSRDQLAIEQAIAKIKKDVAEAGGTITNAEAERLARLQVAARELSRSSGGTSGVEKFDADMARYRERIALLEMETELQRGLNPLVNDYGYALEKARAQHELENAAAKAGLALTPERRAEIESLAESYGTATANAARLAEEQNAIVEQMNAIRDAARSALETIIDGFLEGKDAGEIFSNVLRDIGRQLLSFGIQSLVGGIFPFANGGIAAHGMPQPIKKFARGGVSRTAAIFGEAGPEAAVPLPDGRRIPVDLRMPPMPQVQTTAPTQKLTVHVSLDDELLRAVVKDEAGRTVATAAPTIVGAAVGQANKSAPAAVASYQRQRGGADYRTM